MGQAKPSHDQPSMDEILSSIRRIIERSDGGPRNAGAAADEAAQPVGASGTGRADAPEGARPPMSRSELDKFAEALDARVPATDGETVYDVNGILTLPMDAAGPQDGKYEGRLSEDDSRAFAEVASVLSATAGDLRSGGTPGRDAAPPAMPPEEPDASAEPRESDGDVASPAAPSADAAMPAGQARNGQNDPEAPHPALPEPLVSHDVSRSVGLSFEALSDTLRQQAGRDLAEVTEEMLRPMLADWLDNNLPSMVERLVRAEIERIARGEPRRD
mgnify:CR=1 FL=1